MRHSKKLIADATGLGGYDIAQLAQDAPAQSGFAQAPGSQPGPIHGFVQRHGQTLPFTLDTSQPVVEPQGIVIEQVAIAALVIASFIAPIYHLIG